eukprot:TRINITY_DN20118_c4_g1_i1.p2 TRINITY_DN20118_c4_g1~~TRINITY_DN20118_c4_g1_i1.p2  ORF type:complete len:103 (-),score=0.71 TRINITY_DN20118_c4_g1_i1:260-568(-)
MIFKQFFEEFFKEAKKNHKECQRINSFARVHPFSQNMGCKKNNIYNHVSFLKNIGLFENPALAVKLQKTFAKFFYKHINQMQIYQNWLFFSLLVFIKWKFSL